MEATLRQYETDLWQFDLDQDRQMAVADSKGRRRVEARSAKLSSERL